jgi:uncharacterized membrane protein YeaQ/YmgE (transglycosylase-associated protein family)
MQMTIGALVSWILCGLVVGVIARLLVPGRQDIGLGLTIVLGIVGALVGGTLYALILGVPGEPFSISGNAWHGWIVSVLGAVLVLVLYGWAYPKRWWQ